jgi:hypothetical protein
MCRDITSLNPTWVDISPALNTPYDAIAVDPQIPNHLYVGTDLGMVISTDSGRTWAAVPSNQIPRVIVNDIKINRTTNLVMAFTYGRGAYSGTLPNAAGLVGSTPSRRELLYVADRRDRVSTRARKAGSHDRQTAKAN